MNLDKLHELLDSQELKAMLARREQLKEQRDELTDELAKVEATIAETIGEETAEPQRRKCSNCGQEGHSKRTCSKKE